MSGSPYTLVFDYNTHLAVVCARSFNVVVEGTLSLAYFA